MADINPTEYEHRYRERDTQGDRQPRYNADQASIAARDFNPSTLLDPAMGSRANASAHARAIHDAQHIYGNRAVQRCFQRGGEPSLAHSSALTKSVQRFQGPDSDWWKKTGVNGVMGLSNTVAALPGIGNLGSGMLAGGYLTASTIAGLMGEDQEAKKLRHGASYFGMHAIPGIGNALAAKHAAQDWGAFGENLSGRQAEGSGQSWERDTAPHIDQLLASLF